MGGKKLEGNQSMNIISINPRQNTNPKKDPRRHSSTRTPQLALLSLAFVARSVAGDAERSRHGNDLTVLKHRVIVL